MTDTPPLPKRKRIRKPKPTTEEQVITMCGAMTLEGQIAVYNRLKDSIDQQRIELQVRLKMLEGI